MASVNLIPGQVGSKILNLFKFGTVGSPQSTPPKPGGSVGAIQQMRSLGLDALELGWVQAVRVTPATCEAIKRESIAQNIAISVHAPYFINLNADDTEWPKSRQRLMDAAYYGWLAGATDIIFHPGSYFGKPAEDVLKTAIPRLLGCSVELQEKGITVILRPETMGKSAMLGSLEDCLIMSKEVPGVAPCLDFAHLHARPGDGKMNSATEWRSVIEAYEKALGKVSLSQLHVHLSGIAYSAKGEQNHLKLMDSDFNLGDLFSVLIDNQCGGRILCESPVMEEDALYMRSQFRQLVQKAT